MITTIRNAKLEEVVRIIRIEIESFDEPWDPEIFLGIVSSGCEMKIGSQLVMMNVLELESRLVGYTVWAIDPDCSKGHIMNLAVEESQRGKGLGKELLEFVFNSLRDQGITTCVLEVRVSNLPAIKLYESLGMIPVDRVEGYYSNQEDAIIYRLDL